MPSDEDKFAKLMFGTAVLSALALGLNDFAIQIIARGRKARLSRAVLAEVRQTSITNMKNFDLSGTTIEEDAEIFRQALDQFEKFTEQAIVKGWQS